MCGIVGVACCKGLPASYVKAFRELLYIDSIRGMHSTGILAYNKNKEEAQVYKRALASPDFLCTPVAERILTGASFTGHVLLGHNRHATKGSITDANAHPFSKGDIIGVHNGSLNTWAHHAKGYNVDSAALYDHISQVDDPMEALEEIDGAYALVWLDKKRGSLFMARNDDRPLWTHKTNDGIVWASEKWMLDAVVLRGHIPAYQGNKRLWRAEKFPALSLREYDLETLSIISTRKITPKKSIADTTVVGGGRYTKTNPSKESLLAECPTAGDKIYVEIERKDYEGYSGQDMGSINTWIITPEHSADVNVYRVIKDELKEGVYEVTLNSAVYYPDKYDPYMQESGVVLYADWSKCKYISTANEFRAAGKRDILNSWGNCRSSASDIKAIDDAVLSTTTNGVKDKPLASYKGHGGVLLTPKAFNELTKHGCLHCGCNLMPSDDIEWFDYSTPLCKSCATSITL